MQSLMNEVGLYNGAEAPEPQELFDLRIEYLSNAGIDQIRKEDIVLVEQVINHRNQNAWQMAGAIALDLAARPNSSDSERIEWLANAREFWQSTLQESKTSGITEKATISSKIGLAVLPSYVDIIYNKKIPISEVVKQMYSDLCGIAIMTNEIQKSANLLRNVQPAKDAAGILSELAVLLLHQRYVIQELEDVSKLALPARISEDNDYLMQKADKVNNGWDVSIFEKNPNKEPELTKKAQVKTNRNTGDKKQTYANDIIRVAVRQDLAIANNNGQSAGLKPAQAIATDCKSELLGQADSATIQSLDDRTGKLLDILG